MNSKTSHVLYQFIDKALAESNFVIVDPIDPNGLIYLTPKDYRESSRTWLRSGTQVVVLHNPTNPRDISALASSDVKRPNSSDKLNPLLIKGFGRVLSKRSVLLNMLKNSWDDIKMISLARPQGLGLLRFYLRMVIPLSQARLLKDVSGKMWLTVRFINYIVKLNSHRGSAYVVVYLKLSQLAISRSIGREPLSSLSELDNSYFHKCLTRRGLPSFIPVGDRRRILGGSARTIRFWLTLYGIYRVIQAPSVPKLSTITDPLKATPTILIGLMKFFKLNASFLLSPFYILDMKDMIVKEWINYETSSPTSEVSWKGLISTMKFMEDKYPNMFKTIESYFNLTQVKGESVIDSLFSTYRTVKSIIEDPKRGFADYSPNLLSGRLRADPAIGRLSCKIEPAGKVRVFAMVDVLTQNILRPFHLILSKILKALPNDGTFDQESMVNRAALKAAKYGASYCYDLSAATDRLPILVQRSIVSSLLGSKLASLWQAILVHRPYLLPDHKLNRFIFKGMKGILGKDLVYSTGQPMGALSSFNMLGITHHLIVQYCAFKISVGNYSLTNTLYSDKALPRWCDAYEILGDDIAIFNSDLASKYLEVMSDLGVAINVKKSVIDSKGKTLELAKRTIHHGQDVSAISFRDVLSSAPFAQRVAIVDRVSRRNIMSVTKAIRITSQFYGESPVLRHSYMLLSLFFRAYHMKKVSIYDVFFLLFLIRKYSSAGLNSEFSYSSKITSILELVVNNIFNKGVTSYNSPYRSVFQNRLWHENIADFMFTLLIFYPQIFEDLKRKRAELGDLHNSINLPNRNGKNSMNQLEGNYFTSLLGIFDNSSPFARKLRYSIIGNLYLLDKSFKLFKVLSGLPSVRKIQDALWKNSIFIVNPVNTALKFDILPFIGNDKPRDSSTFESSDLNLGSLDDILYLKEKIISALRDSVIYSEEVESVDDFDFSPLSDFSKIFNSIKLIDYEDDAFSVSLDMTYLETYNSYYWCDFLCYISLSLIKSDKLVFVTQMEASDGIFILPTPMLYLKSDNPLKVLDLD